MSEISNNPVEQIYTFFKDTNGNVDLAKLLKFAQEDDNMKKNSFIFYNKLLNGLKKKELMNRQQFMDYFDQQSFDSEHFDVVFESIDRDGSGYISKKQLEGLLERYKIDATKEQIKLMIEVCSQDGNKVKKDDLKRFLRN